MKSSNNRFFSFGSNSIIGLLFVALFFIALFYLAKGVFYILSWVAPVLLLITLVINYRIVLDYIKWIWNTLRTRTLMGIVLVLVTIFGFPFVSAYLFLKAMGMRSLSRMQRQMQEIKQNDFQEYEILEDNQPSKNKDTTEKEMLNPYDDDFVQ